MITPCPRHVLCPPGTGTDSPGVNYSSEHVDVPEFRGIYWPPTPYGFYTACQGRCISTVSQLDANLCAQRLAKICLNQVTNGKPTYGNTLQICNMPSTGRTVIIPADTYLADSVAEANAMALSAANEQQQDPTTPPGVTIDPPPGGGGSNEPTPPNVIPVPVPVPKKPTPPPPASQCKPCDDTSAVASFTLVCSVDPSIQLKTWESPLLKCGQWDFNILTNDGGPAGSPAWFVVAQLVANDSTRTPVDWGSLTDCPQMAWRCPCASGDCSAYDTQQLAFFPFCCGVTNTNCKYAECQNLPDGGHYMTRLQVIYSCGDDFSPAKQFTVQGTWIAPVPTP